MNEENFLESFNPMRLKNLLNKIKTIYSDLFFIASGNLDVKLIKD
jgi:hypothetical protein